MSQLTNGKIPQGQDCPFASECSFKAFGTCGHKGVNHPCDYSCATARGFDMIKGEALVKLGVKKST
jgi:hypothetical protein